VNDCGPLEYGRNGYAHAQDWRKKKPKELVVAVVAEKFGGNMM